MSRLFLIAAVASLLPMLFMPMNVAVQTIAKLVCMTDCVIFLLLAALTQWRSRGRDAD
jgi:hypothetical protein